MALMGITIVHELCHFFAGFLTGYRCPIRLQVLGTWRETSQLSVAMRLASPAAGGKAASLAARSTSLPNLCPTSLLTPYSNRKTL